jgi:antitoxin component YwqK of YwqJK toxin-antitoxin module
MEWLKHLAVRKVEEVCISINGWRQGAKYVNYRADRLWYEENYVDNKKHGIQRGWYKDGKLLFEVNYVNDEKRGFERIYDRNGEILYDCEN